MDLILEDMTISGFMSFPPYIKQKIVFNNNKLNIIIGKNLDTGDGSGNGAGKTLIEDSLSYNFFGRTIRMSKAGDGGNQGLLNYIESGPLLTITNQIIGKHAFRIERGENPSILRLFEKFDTDSIPSEEEWYTKIGNKYKFETTKAKKPETNKRILEILCFDIKLFDVLLMNNPSDKSCFFKKDEEEQRNIIERIFGFTVFTEKANLLREKRKEENKILIAKESALIATKEANERISREIKDLEERSKSWAIERERSIKLLIQQINTYEKINFSEELEILRQADDLRNQINIAENRILVLSNSLKNLINNKKTWDKNNKEEIDNIILIIETLKKNDISKDIEAINIRIPIIENLKLLNNQIKETEILYNHTISQQRQTTLDKNNLLDTIERLEKEISSLRDSLCPTCQQEWNNNKDYMSLCEQNLLEKNIQIKEVENKIIQLDRMISDMEIDITQKSKEYTTILDYLKSLPEPLVYTTIEEANNAQFNLDIQEEKLSRLKKEKNPHVKMVKELDEENEISIKSSEELSNKLDNLLNNKKLYYSNVKDAEDGFRELEALATQYELLKESENPYQHTINNLRSQTLKSLDETEIRNSKTRIEHMSLLITLLSDRDSPIRKQVLSEWLPQLNTLINNHLAVLELPHKILFDANMTATFHIDGATPTFSNLSAGQQLRAWLATNLAFREIFEMINYRINLFFVDEVLDKGMDERGALAGYNLLKSMTNNNKSVFLISHKQELVDQADNIIEVIYENKLSNLQ